MSRQPKAGDLYAYKDVEYVIRGVHEDTLIQHEDVWEPAVNYMLVDNRVGKTFVRSLTEFTSKFKKVTT